jgi:hypothetical protein
MPIMSNLLYDFFVAPAYTFQPRNIRWRLRQLLGCGNAQKGLLVICRLYQQLQTREGKHFPMHAAEMEQVMNIEGHLVGTDKILGAAQ